MKRKGMFYSLIILIFVIPAVLYVTVYLDTSKIENKAVLTRVRGMQLSNYINSISTDSERSLEMTTRRSLQNIMYNIDISCSYIANSSDSIDELALNGTYMGSPSLFMENSTMNYWAASMQELGNSLGYNTSITIDSLNTRGYNSFSLISEINITIKLSDEKARINVSKKFTKQSIISIEGFLDPLYLVNTRCVMDRPIASSSIPSGPAQVDSAALSGGFMASANGPSFLERMEGRTMKFYAENAGIESILDIKHMDDLGIDVSDYQTRSHVDYECFSSSNGYRVNQSSLSYLRMDPEHAVLYSVNLTIP